MGSKNKTNINLKNNENMNHKCTIYDALKLASEKGHFEIINFLLS